MSMWNCWLWPLYWMCWMSGDVPYFTMQFNFRSEIWVCYWYWPKVSWSLKQILVAGCRGLVRSFHYQTCYITWGHLLDFIQLPLGFLQPHISLFYRRAKKNILTIKHLKLPWDVQSPGLEIIAVGDKNYQGHHLTISVRCLHSSQRILNDSTHPSYRLFTLLTSYKQYRIRCLYLLII